MLLLQWWRSCWLNCVRGEKQQLVRDLSALHGFECVFCVHVCACLCRYVIQGLPIVLLLAIMAVMAMTRALQVLQSKVFHVIPFGSMSNMSLLDICFGIFISGVFMLYFGGCLVDAYFVGGALVIGAGSRVRLCVWLTHARRQTYLQSQGLF